MSDRRCDYVGFNDGAAFVGRLNVTGDRLVLTSVRAPYPRRCRKRKSTAAAMVRVKKTWKNAAAVLLTVAAITAGAAALYFNYAATVTSACCDAKQQSPSSSSSPSFPLLLSSSEEQSPEAVAVEPNRARFSSTVLHASKMYSVCKTCDSDGRQLADRVSSNTTAKG